MFKGYIPTNGKKPAEKIRGRTEFYSLEDVKNLKSYGGVLDNDIIMVDVDDTEESNKLYSIIKDLNIQCNVLNTTRGKHFYFKNTNFTKNCIGKITAIGITVDIKLGSKNAVVPLKIDNIKRKLEIADKLQDIPKWLSIISKVPQFNNLTEGDGRNQTFFNYILSLQSYGFSKEEIKETFKIINSYILKVPLDSKELDIILRDESFQKPVFYKGNTLLHDKFATFLRNEENIIKINNILHIYANGVYKADSTQIEKVMIKYIPGLTKSKRTEVLTYLDLIAIEKALSNSNKIVLSNGLLDLKSNKLEDFTTSYIAKNKISYAYNPAAYSEVMDKTLNKICCNDKNLRSLMEEMLGYTLLRRNELGKAFILAGSGSNGKSTLLDVLKKMLGKENVSSIGLDELGQRFKTADLYGKLANIGDDISNIYIQDNSTFKKLVTGETVNVERKGKDPFDFNNYSKLIFSANEIPRINDTSNGLMRRLVIVPFNAKFSKHDKDFDPFIKDKLMTNEAMEYLLKIAIEGLKRVLNNRGFTEVDSVVEQLHEYEKVNNPVVAFLDDNNIENEHTKDIYLRYSTWCVECKLKALSSIQFSREVCKHGFKTKTRRNEGKRIQIFVKDVPKID